MHLKFSSSSRESSIIKSAGNRDILDFTALLRYLVSTPYRRAKSLSSITCCPLMTYIKFSIGIKAEPTFALTSEAFIISLSVLSSICQCHCDCKFTKNNRYFSRLRCDTDYSFIKRPLSNLQTVLSSRQVFPRTFRLSWMGGSAIPCIWNYRCCKTYTDDDTCSFAT